MNQRRVTSHDRNVGGLLTESVALGPTFAMHLAQWCAANTSASAALPARSADVRIDGGCTHNPLL